MKNLGLVPNKIVNLVNNLPFRQKVLIYAGSLVLLAVIFTVLLITPPLKKVETLRLELENAQSSLSKVKGKAANFGQFKTELEATRAQFQKALLLLPDKKEIPSLLTNISNLGNEAGLEFLLFKPKEVAPKDFYEEIPVEMIVVGPYHNVAVFFDKVSKLPRIVNISNVLMTEPQMVRGAMAVKTSCLATTYRFVESTPGESSDEKK